MPATKSRRTKATVGTRSKTKTSTRKVKRTTASRKKATSATIRKAGSRASAKKKTASRSSRTLSPRATSVRSSARPTARTTRSAKSQASKRTPNAAFMKPMQPDNALAAVVGTKPIPRTQVTKKLWAYIKKNDLQNPKNKRNILSDDKLKAIFKKKEVTMFEMTKLLNNHLS